MNALLQEVLVGVLVAGCALYSAWRLATVRLRLRALEALAALPAASASGWLARLHQRTLAQSNAACGGCSQAGKTRATPDAAGQNQTPGALRR
jgi:hypothetical protein